MTTQYGQHTKQACEAVFTVELTENAHHLIYGENSFEFMSLKECLAFIVNIERSGKYDKLKNRTSDR